MAVTEQAEYWLRGQVADIPALLQPCAHALMQARHEITQALLNFPEEKIWAVPAGVASVGFHLLHLSGVLDRLFTYARGELLSEQQLAYLSTEGEQNDEVNLALLIQYFAAQVEHALTQLKNINVAALTDERVVGRKQIPSTVIGLLFHAAEHTMRHTGQLLVTIAVLKE